jgi:deazaflavin-dependent oxidoreductase (nitroreductase family)
MYKGGRPHRVAAALARATAVLASAGLSPKRLVTLEVRGRRSGRMISQPVVEADFDGERYLVAMLGTTANWVRNVHAAQGRAVIRHRTREPVHLVDVPVADRAPIIRRYLQVAPGARAHIPVDREAPLDDFARIAADYPTFRIVPD